MYTSLAANDFVVAVVTNNHFEPGAYSNMSEVFAGYYTKSVQEMLTAEFELQYLYPNFRLFSSILERFNATTSSYQDLTPSECTKIYNTDYVANHRNLFLITKHSSNTTHKNTLLDMSNVRSEGVSPSSWMCAYHLGAGFRIYKETSVMCNPSDLTSNVASGLPWLIKLGRGEEVEISGCKSEITKERCKVQFSLGIMIVVICCNLVKAGCMVTTVARSREPTLVTLGDAIDSFLRIPDPTTVGICFADQEFIKRVWRHGWKARPRQWKQKQMQRWWTSVGETRWITCNSCYSITIGLTVASLTFGMVRDGVVWNTEIKSM